MNYADTQDFTDKSVLVLLTGDDLNQTAELEVMENKASRAAELNAIKVDKADDRISAAIRELIGR